MLINGTLEWESVFKVNAKSHKYQVDVTKLDKKNIKVLKDEGVEVRHGKNMKKPQPEKGYFVTARSYYQPLVMDATKKPWPSDKKIGNGSKIVVSSDTYPYTDQSTGKLKRGVGLSAVMITDFIEFNGSENKGDELPVVEDGYSLSSEEIPFDVDDDDEDDF